MKIGILIQPNGKSKKSVAKLRKALEHLAPLVCHENNSITVCIVGSTKQFRKGLDELSKDFDFDIRDIYLTTIRNAALAQYSTLSMRKDLQHLARNSNSWSLAKDNGYHLLDFDEWLLTGPSLRDMVESFGRKPIIPLVPTTLLLDEFPSSFRDNKARKWEDLKRLLKSSTRISIEDERIKDELIAFCGVNSYAISNHGHQKIFTDAKELAKKDFPNQIINRSFQLPTPKTGETD